MAPAPSLVGLFIAPLNRTGIEYMATGGLAAVVYGHPRLTLDVDLVIRLAPRDIDTFAGLWSPDQFYCPPKKVIAEERDRSEHGHFNVIHHDTAMRADCTLPGATPCRVGPCNTASSGPSKAKRSRLRRSSTSSSTSCGFFKRGDRTGTCETSRE